MSLSAPMSPVARVRLTRRGVLALPVLAGAGVVLAGCGVLKKGDSDSSGQSSGAATSTKSSGAASSHAAVATEPGPHGGVVLSTEYDGHPLTVEVGPVAVKGKYTVARLHISTDSKKAVYFSQAFTADADFTAADVRMMSLERSLVYPELARNKQEFQEPVTKRAPKDVFTVFSALSDGVTSVEMMLPNMGIAVGVPVVKESEVDFTIDDVIAKANLVESDPGPFKLERATMSMDGAASPTASAGASSASAPDPEGPVGKGPEGVDVKVDGKTVHMVIDQVARVGEYLVGNVVLTSDEMVEIQAASFTLPDTMKDARGLSGEFNVSSLTILSGGVRHLEADYADSHGSRIPLANPVVYALKSGVTQSLPVVWPDVGEDNITIDIPSGESRYAKERIVARLTDVPVISA